MNDMEQLLRTAALGMDVRVFLDSPVGQYLIKRAETEVESALVALKDVDPENPRLIRELQNRAYRAQTVLQWLAEAIQEGENAERMAAQED